MIQGKDSSFRSVKRRMQDMLLTAIPVSGSFTMLSQLGLKTERDGTLTVDSTVLDKAISDDLDDTPHLRHNSTTHTHFHIAWTLS